jgi:hypothetical protein
MPAYSVLEPRHLGSIAERADRIVFVRDGFSWGAFLLTPVWLVYRKLWLALLAYLVVLAALNAGLWVAGIGPGGQLLVGALVSWLIGMEAGNLRRWTLTRRGWQELGTVVSDDRDEAERRFFDAWVAGEVALPAPRPLQPESVIRPSARPDVIGLFPAPGGGR